MLTETGEVKFCKGKGEKKTDLYVKAVLTVIAVCLVVTPCSARIDETKAQCRERYGEVLSEKDGLYFYKKQGFFVVVSFYNRKADSINYMKVETNALGEAKEMSDNEKKNFLEANAGGRKWVNMPLEWERWEIEDGALMASYDVWKNTLFIYTEGHLERFAKKRKAEEDKNQEQF